ncbi:MAG: SulP family inorganic anion transporter [Thermodesulfovibrionales bacterium]|nr:SulP family inorganic anion transporter [Thermodesulfovibrionales bacterium]
MSSGIFRINRLGLDNLRNDFYGGLTAAVVALPLAMAFGVASGAGPMAGMYGAILIGFFAALLGGTPSQISGPTGPMTVVMAGIFAYYTSLDPVSGAAIAFTVVAMGGVFQVLFGVFRLGHYIRLVPHPVISGFMSGIGVIIILLQIGPLLGHPSEGNPMGAVREFGEVFANINPHALGLGVLTLAIVYLLPARINRTIPAPLLALVCGTLVSTMLYKEGSVSVLGNIPTGFPSLVLPAMSLNLLAGMVKSALILALLGSIDSLLTSLVADSATRSHHDSNRELIGQGIGNTIAGLFGGLPGAGATMRTIVNVRAGGRTHLSGAIHAVALLSVVMGAGSIVRHIPHVVLAGILIKVGTDIIDWGYLKRSKVAPKTGVALMVVVMLITVFVDLITSVAVGMVAASLILVNRMAKLQMKSIKAISDISDESPLCEEAMAIVRAAKGRILVYHLSGPLSFGAAKDMARRLSIIAGYEALVLDLSDVTTVDTTSAMAIEDMILGAQATGRHVFLSGAHTGVRALLDRMGILGMLRKGHEFPERLQAIQEAASILDIPWKERLHKNNSQARKHL